MATLAEKAEILRSLHRRGDPLVLINVWDAASARIVEELGFPAIATTSAGISWLEGVADGERLSRDAMLQGAARVARAVRVPVTADLEAGYGRSAEDAAATARGAIEAGAVGLNFEDWDERRSEILDADVQASRVAAMRAAGLQAGVPLVINARTDVFLQGLGESDTWRVQEAARRGNRYLEAGADCIFVPGVTDERTIAALTHAIQGPVNVLAGPATPSVARLAELGVARVSVGASAMAFALTQLRALARDIKETGTFGFGANRLSHAEINALFP
jgi:2-methylisocitrate lyase-like PEP mutase family enzyme